MASSSSTGVAARGARSDRLGRGPERADDHAAVRRVRAEEGVRVAVCDGRRSQSVSGERSHASLGSSSSRRIPATGIATQSGRLLSS